MDFCVVYTEETTTLVGKGLAFVAPQGIKEPKGATRVYQVDKLRKNWTSIVVNPQSIWRILLPLTVRELRFDSDLQPYLLFTIISLSYLHFVDDVTLYEAVCPGLSQREREWWSLSYFSLIPKVDSTTSESDWT